jgi:hypothetical protein
MKKNFLESEGKIHMSKEIFSRIINKHDIESNWNKATSFIPQ